MNEMRRWIARWENEGGALARENDRGDVVVVATTDAARPPARNGTGESFTTSPLFLAVCAVVVAVGSWLSFNLCNLWPGPFNYLHQQSHEVQKAAANSCAIDSIVTSADSRTAI